MKTRSSPYASRSELFLLHNPRPFPDEYELAGLDMVDRFGFSVGPALLALQSWDVNVQVHPVDSFHFQGDVLGQHFGNTSWYAHFGSGTTPILRDRPLRRFKPLARTACSSPLSTG